MATVRLTRSARKHGIGREEIRGVLAAPVRTVVRGDAVLHIGLTPRRDLVEVVVVPGDPVTAVHAMLLRPSNFHHLRTGGPSCPDGPR